MEQSKNQDQFYFFELVLEQFFKDENGEAIFYSIGQDLDNLKKYIKIDDDNEIQCLLKKLYKKGYISNCLSSNRSIYGNLQISVKGQKYLEDLCKDKLETLKWIITTFIAVIGLIFSILGYFFPNETKIQTIVKTELKNTTNVNITK